MVEGPETTFLAGKKAAKNDFSPPDGGAKAVLVMIGSFFCNGILFGVVNSYSVFYEELYQDLTKKHVSNASGKAALVGSLAMGTVFFISPVSGVMTDFMGIRTTTFVGGALMSAGMLLSSFFVERVEVLYFTFGIMYGLGGALAYTPSLTVLGHYFKRYLGVVNGIVTAGSSAFTITMPYLMSFLLKTYGFDWTLRVLAAMSSTVMIFAFFFKPLNLNLDIKKVTLKDAFNVSLFKNRRYIVWAAIISFSLFGYFIPYVYMVDFVKTTFGEEADGKLPVLCIGIASGIGRLVFGFVGDVKGVDKIVLQQVAFLAIGVMTISMPFAGNAFALLVAISLCLGFFDGCFISILGPIAFEICGQAAATQAIGFLFGLCAIPLTLGPFLAGIIYTNANNSYTIPLILAGIPPIVGSIAMLLIPRGPVLDTRRPKTARTEDDSAAAPLDAHEEERRI